MLEFSMPRIPIGDSIDIAVDWLKINLAAVFDAISAVLEWLISLLETIVGFLPAWVMALLLGALAWRMRSLIFGVFTAVGFTLIDGMALWAESMDTLALVVTASFVAVVIGIPLGIAAARNELVSTLVRPILDFMQTMPAFVYLIPAAIFFGIGLVPGAVATVVFSMPPAVRLTELGIRQVDKEVVEAGEAFGSAPMQILTRIQIPLALPTIMAGVNQVIMLALSMVVIAGIVGAGGLGAVVIRGITRLQVGLGFEGGLAVVILAIFLDRITAAFSERSDGQAEA